MTIAHRPRGLGVRTEAKQDVQFIKRALAKTWRAAGIFLWCLIGLWTALAVHFTLPAPWWVATPLAVAIGAVYAWALRERFVWKGRFGWRWREAPRSTVAVAVTAVVAAWYFSFGKPDPNREWAPEHSRIVRVTFDGDIVHVKDARNFTWRSATEFTQGWYDRDYDLSKLNSMYYLVVPLNQHDAVAHVFVCFGFSDGQAVAVSVEGRREKGRPYQLIGSMFRQNQLIFAIGDERDLVGLRGAIWKQPVRFYPARGTIEGKRAVFIDLMQRAHDLEEHPEFYHLIVNNCMNNITRSLRRVGHQTLPREILLLLTGLSDRLAYRYGFIDTDLPFEVAREAFRVDGWMRETVLDGGFSIRLRETIVRQVEAARASLAARGAGATGAGSSKEP